MPDPAREAVEQLVDRAREHWRQRGSALTSVRRVICEVAFTQEGYFDARTLLERARTIDGLISPASVYRTLGALVEAGLLREFEGIEGQRWYHLAHSAPDILSAIVCRDCGMVIPATEPCPGLSHCHLAAEKGFHATRIRLRVEATCEHLARDGHCPNFPGDPS